MKDTRRILKRKKFLKVFGHYYYLNKKKPPINTNLRVCTSNGGIGYKAILCKDNVWRYYTYPDTLVEFGNDRVIAWKLYS